MKPQIDEIEMEAKGILSNLDYQGLVDSLTKDFGGSTVDQINKYFDTEDLYLFNNLPPGTTLRVREKKGVNVLEFKLPKGDFTEEYKDDLDEDMLNTLFQFGILPPGNISAKMKELGIYIKFKYQGDLLTKRTEIKPNIFPEATVLLDESLFPNKEKDWEIEVESGNYEYSQQVLSEILERYQIPLHPSIRKIQRFYQNLI